MFIILSSSISICTGFKPPTTWKFCCVLTMIFSTGCDMFSFLFLPSLVIEKLCTFFSFILGLSPFMWANWNFKPFLVLYFRYKTLKCCLHLVIYLFFSYFARKITERAIYWKCLVNCSHKYFFNYPAILYSIFSLVGKKSSELKLIWCLF